MRRVLLPLAMLALGGLSPAADAPPTLAAPSADALRGHVSFLASDVLLGRVMASPGADVAAEYIAARFRAAGLAPLGDEGYFQDIPAPAPTGSASPAPAGSMRNVAGLLRGRDPVQRETHVLVTAHYDGTGPNARAKGDDRIWNAANDNASGVAAVIELGALLSAQAARPPRSIVFMAFAGEERGLLGSRHYAAHPLVPLAGTVAHVNVEHLGRVDSTTAGDRRRHASLTGWELSSLPALFQRAGARTGIRFDTEPRRSQRFFAGSDNLSLARVGVVAHTVCVLFDDYTDYHGSDDEWEKIDYENLAATTRMIGTAVLMLASDAPPPTWNEGSEAAAPYAAAARRLRNERR